MLSSQLKSKTNQINEYPLFNNSNSKIKVWLTWIPNSENLRNGYIATIDNLQGYCSIYNNKGQFIGNLEIYENLNKDFNIYLNDILNSTGLQIKYDPSISIIYTGFFFLMISTFLSYITYSQIWIYQEKYKTFIGGNTNRATFEFESEFFDYIRLPEF